MPPITLDHDSKEPNGFPVNAGRPLAIQSWIKTSVHHTSLPRSLATYSLKFGWRNLSRNHGLSTLLSSLMRTVRRAISFDRLGLFPDAIHVALTGTQTIPVFPRMRSSQSIQVSALLSADDSNRRRTLSISTMLLS